MRNLKHPMSNSLGARIDKHIDQGQWVKAERLIRRERRRNPNDHWLLTRLSSLFLAREQDHRALASSKKALKLAPHCPLVLWDYASALDAMKRHQDAIDIWRQLPRRGANRIAFNACGEGIPWARSLLNDCLYRIGFSSGQLGRTGLAIRYMKMHLQARDEKKVSSIYPRRFVVARLRDCQKALKTGCPIPTSTGD